MSIPVTVVDAPPATLGEGPMWSPRDRALFWIDVVGKTLFRFQPAMKKTETRSLPFAPSAVFPHAEGGLLLVTKKGLALYDFEKNELKSIPAPGIDFSVEIFNDGACDLRGRLWLGTRHFHRTEPLGSLYCLTSDFKLTRQSSGFVVSNGLAWSLDRRTLYHVETRPGRIYAYDFDEEEGSVSNRRTLIEYGSSRAGHPDGCTIDAEGGLWVAEVEGSCIARYSPDGRLDREIPLPVSKPTSVMFGGDDLSTLFVTSMTFGLSDSQLQGETLAGRLLAVDAGVKGLPEPVFGLKR